MDAYMQRAVELFREKVGIYQRRRDEGDAFASIHLYGDVVAVLKEENPDVVATLITLLNDNEASDMHYWIFIAMRGMAQRGELSHDAMRIVLVHTIFFATGDYEEWYKSSNALACSSEGAQILLDFAENHLLGKRDVRGWRWFAFQMVGIVSIRHASLISTSLKDKLKEAMDQETDTKVKRMFQEFLAVIEKS